MEIWIKNHFWVWGKGRRWRKWVLYLYVKNDSSQVESFLTLLEMTPAKWSHSWFVTALEHIMSHTSDCQFLSYFILRPQGASGTARAAQVYLKTTQEWLRWPRIMPKTWVSLVIWVNQSLSDTLRQPRNLHNSWAASRYSRFAWALYTFPDEGHYTQSSRVST